MRMPAIVERRHDESAVPSAVLGILTGLAVGILLSRGLPARRRLGDELARRAREAARRMRPGRLYRAAAELEELDSLEDTVLSRFLADEVLRERPIDIGAISLGVIELSGSVRTQDEADRALALANGVEGVHTVINRLDVTASGTAASPFRRRLDSDELASTFTRHEARVGGMGRRRQSPATDPDRRDDSQKLRERALAAADRQQFRDEGLGEIEGRGIVPSEPASEGRTRYREDQLDNQDPHGKHASLTLDEQPQELNTNARVGEPPKPGVRRQIEDAEVPFGEPPRDQ